MPAGKLVPRTTLRSLLANWYTLFTRFELTIIQFFDVFWQSAVMWWLKLWGHLSTWQFILQIGGPPVTTVTHQEQGKQSVFIAFATANRSQTSPTVFNLCFYLFAFNTAETLKLESNEPRLLLPLRIMLFCFDFAGSGISEGEYISLGWCFDSHCGSFRRGLRLVDIS